MSVDSNNIPLNKNAKVVIVGAGVFGLSSALHLARRGYTQVHLFDKQPYEKNNYAFSQGADAASADENKILRASYGDAKIYQQLAFQAMSEWQSWNDLVANTCADQLPDGLTPDTKLWINCGYLRLSANGLESEEVQTQKNFPPELKGSQYRVSDARRRADAQADGIPAEKLDPFKRREKCLPTDGILDMTAGFVLASRACAFALMLCRQAGVHTHFGQGNTLDHIIRKGDRAIGISTVDGTRHEASLVVIACGGWTPFLLPEVERLLETTAGSVLSIQLPRDRTDLWDKYSPEKFPVWQWRMYGYGGHGSNSIGGLYGLPRTPEGVVKFVFRGAKWTNYTGKTSKGEPLSFPRTDVDQVPEEAMRVVRKFCAENMPDLLGLPLQYARLCWYTDSVDNSFLIDYVPGVHGLVVASGGSGHGFKFLPILGRHVVDVVEGKCTAYTKLFSWRDVPTGKRNGLEEGPGGWRNLRKHSWAGQREWKL